MKIIKEGNIERIKETKMFECKRCGCVFKADKGEYKVGSHYNDIYFLCTCPTCGSSTYTE